MRARLRCCSCMSCRFGVVPLKTKNAESSSYNFLTSVSVGRTMATSRKPADALGTPPFPPNQLELVEVGNLRVIFVILGNLAFLVERKVAQRTRIRRLRRSARVRCVVSRAASDCPCTTSPAQLRRSATSTTTAIAVSPAAHPANNPKAASALRQFFNELDHAAGTHRCLWMSPDQRTAEIVHLFQRNAGLARE